GLAEDVVAAEVEAGIGGGDRDAVDFGRRDAGVGERRAHRFAGQGPRPAGVARGRRRSDSQEVNPGHFATIAGGSVPRASSRRGPRDPPKPPPPSPGEAGERAERNGGGDETPASGAVGQATAAGSSSRTAGESGAAGTRMPPGSRPCSSRTSSESRARS